MNEKKFLPLWRKQDTIILTVILKERCRSGRSGRSRKPLCLSGTQGSNPCLSAIKPDYQAFVVSIQICTQKPVICLLLESKLIFTAPVF